MNKYSDRKFYLEHEIKKYNLIVLVESVALIIAYLSIFIACILMFIYRFKNPSLTETELVIYSFTRYKYLFISALVILITHLRIGNDSRTLTSLEMQLRKYMEDTNDVD